MDACSKVLGRQRTCITSRARAGSDGMEGFADRVLKDLLDLVGEEVSETE